MRGSRNGIESTGFAVQARRLYIVSVEEYLRYLAEQRRKLVGEISTMHTQETEAGDKVDEIKTKKPE